MPKRTAKEPTESITIRFRNLLHYQYHAVLMEYGFDFTVGHDLMTGLRYTHSKKPIIAIIKDDEQMEWYCENPQGTMYYQEHFTEAEWQYMFGEEIEEPAALARMLHVLVRVRPNSLNTMVIQEGRC